MNYILWVIGGFVALFVSNAIQDFGDMGATPEERLPFYGTALFVLALGLYCFFKGWRGSMKEIADGKASGAPKTNEKKAWSDPLDEEKVGTNGSFDADAALARYMERRSSDTDGVEEEAQERPHNRPAFGRKRES